jgi:hypothetical protein
MISKRNTNLRALMPMDEFKALLEEVESFRDN